MPTKKQAFRDGPNYGDLNFARRFGSGQNLGRKRTGLHFDDESTKGEDSDELNCFQLNAVEVYIGTAASRKAYLENQTNGCCGD